jgi:hypothetical protein
LEKKKKPGKKKDLPRLPLPPKYTKANPTAPPNQARAWKKLKLKHDDIKALIDDGFLREQIVDMWNTTAGSEEPRGDPLTKESSRGNSAAGLAAGGDEERGSVSSANLLSW